MGDRVPKGMESSTTRGLGDTNYDTCTLPHQVCRYVSSEVLYPGRVGRTGRSEQAVTGLVRMKQLIAALIFGYSASVQSVLGAGGEGWANENLKKGETVLCERQEDGEYFFVAEAGDKIKLGTRLDMTEYPGEHVFRIAWNFRNEKDDPVSAEIAPKVTKQGYAETGNKLFVETIEYQTLAIGESKTVRVSVEIGKCAGRGCDKQAGESKKDRKYEVEVCTVKASAFLPR